MATTAKTIVPDKPKTKKPISKAHKAKLAAALANWRASLTDKDREAWRAQNRTTHQQRWAAMTKKERDARLAGVRAWQAAQRAAKAAKAKAAPKVAAKAVPRKRSRATEVSESATPARTRKAAAK